MRATISAMRIAAIAALVLVLAGCGSGGARTGAELNGDAAELVPPDALAFVNVDTGFDSKQWRAVGDLVGPGLDLQRVKGAVGDGLSLAVLGVEDGKPDAVAFAKPRDEAKLRQFASTFDTGDEHYTVEQVGDWSVVADSADTFAAVRHADSGRSLADDADFKAASATFKGDSLVTAFVAGAAAKQLPGQLGAFVRAEGSAEWFAARLVGEQNALRLEVQARSLKPAPAVYRPTLLRDVPSGAIAAVSFKNLDRVLGRLPALKPYLGVRVADLLPALRGEGTFYVLPGVLIPVFALDVQSPNPQAAAQALRKLTAKGMAKVGNVLALRVARYGSRVVLTNGPAAGGSSGGALVDDQPFKDALAAAGAPAQVSFLAYADVQRLKPILETLTQLLGKGTSSPKSSPLDRIATVVAFGTGSRLVIRATLR